MTPIELETRCCAQNDAPLAVVLARGDGAHIYDTARSHRASTAGRLPDAAKGA